MKKTPKQYAVAFYQAAQGKKAKELDRVVLGFVKILQRDNKLSWKEKILAELTLHSNKKEGIKELEITSARELSKTQLSDLKKKFARLPCLPDRQAERQGEEKQILAKEKVSPEILGGLILKLDDKLWNFSLKNQLNTLKNQLKTN